MTENVLLEGEKMTIGGREFTVPPLSIGRIRKLLPLIREVSTPQETAGKDALATIEDYIGKVAQIVFLAIQRNYPEITQEEVEDLLDLRNAAPTLRQVLAVSGFVPVGEQKPGEEAVT